MLEIDQLLLTLPQKPAEWRDARGGDGFDRKRRRWEKGDNPDPGSIVDFAESLWAFVHRVGNKEIAAFTFKRLCELAPDGNKGWMEQDARTDLKQRELMFVEWFVGLRKKGRITYSRRLEAEASLRESPEQMQPKETRIPGPADEAKTAGLNEQVGRFVQVRIAKGLSGLPPKKRTQNLCYSLLSLFDFRSQAGSDNLVSCGAGAGCKRLRCNRRSLAELPGEF